MIAEILTAAGVSFRQGRYIPPFPATYAVYFDDTEEDGADIAAASYVTRHTVRVEVYEAAPDPAAEAAIERECRARGLRVNKEDRYWLQDTQRYQVLYTFDYTTKK